MHGSTFRWTMVFVSFLYSIVGGFSQDSTASLWDEGLFRATADQIVQAEIDSELPNDRDAGILYSHGRFDYQDDGSLVRRVQTVYRIDTEEGLRSWGQIEINWSPWHQDRPQLRGRITNPDKAQFEITDRDLVEASASNDTDSTYTDERTLKGPLPRAKIGSIVELESTYVIRPLLENCGILQYWSFSKSVPTSVTKLTITLPARSPFSMKARGALVPAAKDRVEKGRKIWELTQVDLFEPETYEEGLPRSVNTSSYLVFSTAPGWEKIANSYSAVIDQKIRSQPLEVPKEAIVPNDLRRTSVNLMRWITSHVRYIALELGQNSIVPYGPADIVKRGYGDCKDKATILTSFLRQAGYDASVSLIQVSNHEDITVQVPGMECFDHAIVYVAGKDPLWLDPTVEFGRDENLPSWDQGRWSLPARDGVKVPLTTGFTDLSYHVSEETREYVLQDEGRAFVEQKSSYAGGMDLYRRESRAYRSPDAWKKDLETYAEKTFQATLGKYSSTDPYNFDVPFKTTYQFKESNLATTGSVDAVARVAISSFLDWIPKDFLSKSDAKRKNEYFLTFPVTAVETHRFRPPTGFVARGLPEPVHKTWGAFSFDLDPKLEADGTVEIKLTLRALKRTLSPTEFDRTQSLVWAYYQNAKDLELNFDLEAEVLLREGKSGEAFQKYRDSIAKDPKKSIHEVRLSKALLKSGLGLQAVKSATKATELDPKNASVWDNLAWIKQHDGLGRRFGANYDRDGAIRAYERSLQLDPSSVTARADLAILHEFDAYGLRYSNRSELAIAAREYEEIQNELGDYKLHENYAIVLLHLDRVSEAKAYVQTWEASDAKDMYLLVANSLLKSPEQAVKDLNPQLTKEKRASVSESAAQTLLQMRRYPQAGYLLRTAAKGSTQAANLDYRADLAAKAKKAEVASMSAKTPVDVVKSFIESILLSEDTKFEPVRRFVAPPFFEAYTNPTLKNGIYQVWTSAVRMAIKQNMPMGLYADFTEIGSRFDVQTSGTHAYVVVRNPADSNAFVQSYYLRSVEGQWTIWGSTVDMRSFVDELSARAKRGEIDQVVLPLDWFSTELNPRTEYGKSFQLLWPKGKPKTAEHVVAALKYLRACFARTLSDLSEFEADPPKSFSDERTWSTLRDAAVTLEHRDKYFEYSKRLFDTNSDDETYRAHYYHSLIGMKKFTELEIELSTRLKNEPDEALSLEAYIDLYTQKLDPQAIKTFVSERKIELTAMQMNNLAWIELFGPRIGEGALELARKSVNLTNSKEAGVLHTLATLYAEVERFEDARAILDQAIALSVDDQPRSHDWYVLGRISEGYGFYEAAKEAYAKVERDEASEDSTWVLVQKRLVAMKKAGY